MKNANSQKSQTPDNFVAYNYMSNSKTIREGLFKVPLIKPSNITTEKHFKLQKLPDIPPKRLMNKEEKKEGYNNVCFNGLTFKRVKQYDWKNGQSQKYMYLEEEKMKKHTAYSLLTGSKNNLVVLDLDCMKETWLDQKNNHPFIKYYNKKYNLEPNENYLISIENIIKKINTYSVKTQSGGFHIYFKTENAGAYPSTASKTLEVDIRGEGGLIVGAYSRIIDTEGNIKEYKPFTDIEVDEIGDHSEFINSVYEKTPVSKNRKDKINMKKYQNIKLNPNLYSFYVDDELLNKIENRLPITFFQDPMEYLKLTAFYKKINRQTEWDNISKKHSGYNYTNNMNMWNSADTGINSVEYVLKKIGKLHYLNYIKYKDIIHNKIKPDEIVNSKGKKGLSEVLNIETNKNYVIKSGTATGKTYSINEYIHKHDHKLLSIVSRTTLAQEHQRVFGSWYEKTDPELAEQDNYILYSEHRNEWLGLFEGDNMIIQIDSIEKISGYDFSEYVVYIDELNSVFEYLMSSSTLASRRRSVYKLLCRILKECKQFIGTDADISDLCMYWLNPEKYITGLLPEDIKDFISQSPNIECEYIQNTHNHYQGVKATELFSYDELVKLISKEEKFMVCCDSATEARNLRNKLNKDNKDKYNECIVIDRLYSDKDESDLDNIHQVIFSPKIVYGLDSQMERKVFCLFKGHTIPAKSMLQQIARCRNQDHLYYYFMDKKEILKDFEFNNTGEVVDKIKYLDSYINSYFKQQIEREEIEEIELERQSFYNYLIGFYLYNLDADCSNKFFHFTNGLRRIGYDITSGMKMSLDVDKKLAKELSELTSEELETHFHQNKEEEYYQRINEIIKLPQLEDYDKYMDIFIKPEKLQQHLNYCNLYLKDTTLNELKNEYKDKEFCANVSLGDTNKINWIKELCKKVSMEEGSLKPTKILTPEEAVKYKEEYLKLFRHQGKKDKLDFENKYKLGVILKSAMDTMCGDIKKDPFVSPYKSIQFKEGKGKDRKSITSYEVDLGCDTHKYHKGLFLYRINKKKYLKKAFNNYQNKCKMKELFNNMKLNKLENPKPEIKVSPNKVILSFD
tara:strand:- start:7269 stop:10496 length:3228 start_codon:yes stop_codon:yes gene_type:complete